LVSSDLNALLIPFLTVVVTIFITELTDKDALLLLTLATRINPWITFAAGSVAFTTTSAIIVTVGYFLVSFLPVSIVRFAGGLIMIGFAFWQYVRSGKEIKEDESDEKRILNKTRSAKSAWSVFFAAVSLLILLDLAGDATEVLTIVYVARYPALLVFVGAVIALVAASALETVLGRKVLKRVVSAKKMRVVSLVLFLIIGTFLVLSTFVQLPF